MKIARNQIPKTIHFARRPAANVNRDPFTGDILSK